MMVTLHGQEVKVNDKVWDCVTGWDTVIELDEADIYPIDTESESYATNGKSYQEHESPRLFWQAFTIPPHAYEKPKQKVKKYLVSYKYGVQFYLTTSCRNEYFSNEAEFKEKMPIDYRFISIIPDSETEFDA